MCKITVVCTKSRFTCAAYIYIYILKKMKVRNTTWKRKQLMAKKRGRAKRKGGEEKGGGQNNMREGKKERMTRQEKREKRVSTVFPLRCAVSIRTDLPSFSSGANWDSGLFRSKPNPGQSPLIFHPISLPT